MCNVNFIYSSNFDPHKNSTKIVFEDTRLIYDSTGNSRATPAKLSVVREQVCRYLMTGDYLTKNVNEKMLLLKNVNIINTKITSHNCFKTSIIAWILSFFGIGIINKIPLEEIQQSIDAERSKTPIPNSNDSHPETPLPNTSLTPKVTSVNPPGTTQKEQKQEPEQEQTQLHDKPIEPEKGTPIPDMSLTQKLTSVNPSGTTQKEQKQEPEQEQTLHDKPIEPEKDVQKRDKTSSSDGHVQSAKTSNKAEPLSKIAEIQELEAQCPYRFTIQFESIKNVSRRKKVEQEFKRKMLLLALTRIQEFEVDLHRIPARSSGISIGRCGHQFYLTVGYYSAPVACVNGAYLPDVGETFTNYSASFSIGENTLNLSGETVKITIEARPEISTDIYNPKQLHRIVTISGTTTTTTTYMDFYE